MEQVFDIKKFLMMHDFSKKIRYANSLLPKIGVGSSRIIYKIDDAKVLKLAKNAKGVAQNSVESDYAMNDMYGDVIAKVLESDPDDRWVISELAKKITKTRFKQLMGGISLQLFYAYLFMTAKPKESRWRIYDVPKEIQETLNENEFYHGVRGIIGNFDMDPIGDFQKINTYGEIDGRLVVVDYGLTRDIYNAHYAKK